MILVDPGWYGEYDYAGHYSESDFSDVSDETYNSCESNEFGYSAGFGFGDFCILVTMVILMNMLFLAILVNMMTLLNLFILVLHLGLS